MRWRWLSFVFCFFFFFLILVAGSHFLIPKMRGLCLFFCTKMRGLCVFFAMKEGHRKNLSMIHPSSFPIN